MEKYLQLFEVVALWGVIAYMLITAHINKTSVYLVKYDRATLINILNNYCDEKHNFYITLKGEYPSYKLICTASHMESARLDMKLKAAKGGTMVYLSPESILNGRSATARSFYMVQNILKGLE